MKRNRGGRVQGQRSISAFFQPKENGSNAEKPLATPLAERDNQVGATAAPSACQQDAGVRPPKKARLSPQPGIVPDQPNHPVSENASPIVDSNTYVIPGRNAYQHLRAQAKLAAPPPRETTQGEQRAVNGAGQSFPPSARAGASNSRGKVKYTPLEEQVCSSNP